MWISNPLTNSLFVPLATTLSGLLSVGFFGVWAGRRFTKDVHLKNQLLLRWCSWFAIAVVSLGTALSGLIPFALLTAVVSLIGTGEYCRIAKQNKSIGIALLIFGFLMPLVTALRSSFLTPVAFLGFIVIAILSMSKSQKFDRLAISVLGIFYVPFLASHMVALFQSQSAGLAMVLAVIASSALANIMAFVFGKAFKGPKLASSLSPNKTWSGAAGSVFGAYAGFSILTISAGINVSTFVLAVIPLVVAVSGIIGDLFESSLKRHFELKDAGTCLPGFGGVLDRIDGLLFVVPSVYYTLRLLQGV